MNLILCGFMGCGKTTVGRLAAQKMLMQFVDTDDMVEQTQGQPVSRIFDRNGEAFFRRLEHTACVQAGQGDNLVISTGGGALTFRRNVDALKANGMILFLDVPFARLAERIGQDENRPLFRDREKAQALYEARTPLYRAAADYVVDGTGEPEAVAQLVCDCYKKNCVRGLGVL